MKIHIESGQILIDNQITGESLYNFLRAQQDLTKKILKVNVAITYDFDHYIKEVLANITDDRYDINSNSTSKFLFYHFNTFRQAQGKSFLEIRHSVIADNDYALENLQNKNWQYFIETLLFVTSDQLSEFEESEKDILRKTFDNLNYYKDYYQLARAVNESKEIPQKTAREARKELFNSLLNVDGRIAADAVQDLSDVRISNIRTENKSAKRDFVEHVKSTIKKDNVDYLATIKRADNSSNEAAIASFSAEFPTLTEIIRRPPGKFTIKRSKRLAEKTPYQK